MSTENRGELVIVDRRASARAFSRDPGAVEPSNGDPNTVGPDSPPTAYAVGAEPVIIDGDAMSAAYPGPTLAPQPWAGFPSQWQPAWNNGGAGMGGALGGKVSTVFSCVDLNARALASMPLTITEDGRPVDPTEYEWTENPEPRLYAGWGEFMTQAVASLLTSGDLYVHATDWDYETLLPTRFMVVDPSQVTCQFDADGVREYWIGGAPVMPWELRHVRYMTIAGYPTGISPLQGAAGSIRSAAALEAYGAGLAEQGGVTWGVLTSEQRITRRQAALAQQQWIEAQQSRRGAPAVLGSGLELKTLTLSPRDMALLDLRVFDEQRIAAVLGVPPYLIGLEQPQGLTYANATSLFDFHHRGMLRPTGRKITEPLSSWLLPRRRKLHLNAGDYVQPPLAERTTSYKAMHEAGALTLDEWRALEGLPPLTADQQAQRPTTATPDSAVTQ